MSTIGVTSGMRGWYAVQYDHDGPIQTGIGSYRTAGEAWREAEEWAQSEGLPLDRGDQARRPVVPPAVPGARQRDLETGRLLLSPGRGRRRP